MTRDLVPFGMSESQLQEAVLQLAALTGWLTYHTFDSRRSAPGFPDLVLLQPMRGRLLIRELKGSSGRLTPHQSLWIRGLQACGVDAGVWRPADWSSGRIEQHLL